MLALAVVTGLIVIDTPLSDAEAASALVTLAPPTSKPAAVVLRGKAPVGAKVRILRRTESGWVRVGADRANRLGRYRMRMARPEDRAWVVRAISSGTRSGKRRIYPVPASADPPRSALAPADPPPVDACGEQPQKADGTRWDCSFVDEFDGTELNPNLWRVQETWLSGMTSGNGDCYVNDSKTIGQRNGKLLLTALFRDKPFICQSPFGAFETDSTAATVTTRDRFSQTYGRFAFRAKFPDSAGISGMQSALWLYPKGHPYGAWPKSGEIDVAEWFSSRPENVYPSVHYEGDDWQQSTGFTCAMPTSSTAFHTYVVELSPQEMRFYYDGKLCFRHSWTPAAPLTAPQPFDKPFSLVLTQFWGSSWNAVTSETPQSATLTVDWAKAWK